MLAVELAASFGGAAGGEPDEPDEPDLAADEWLLPMVVVWGGMRGAVWFRLGEWAVE